MRYGFLGRETEGTQTVVAAFERLGWQRVHGRGWDALWSYALRESSRFLPLLEPTQRFNHLPGWRHYAGKRNSATIERYRRESNLADTAEWDFCPLTYLLPYQADRFRQVRAEHPDWFWLTKPARSGTQGRGLRVLDHAEEPPAQERLYVQRYIDDPHLIDSRKYNVRVVAMLPCVDPLLVYIHRETNIVLAAEPYSLRDGDLSNLAAHIINAGLQRDFQGSDNAIPRLTNAQWRDILRRDGANPEQVWASIGAAIAKFFQAAHDPFSREVRAIVPHRLNCFELLGFDILLDRTFKPWILECNLNPTISSRTVSVERFNDVLSLAGINAAGPPPASPRFGKTPIHTDIHDLDGLNLLSHRKFDWLEHERRNSGGFERVVPAIESAAT